ncbi:MAG: ABC transporter ATP-binding protein [Baileyella intestinalis]|uniref:ABC transporter ATP-binding protein n=1 Tax=Baileyella intestinalis TaxID=2606709 RepID=A0A6A8M5R3_9FIRM|nr:ABC transporter ATP-binding protein [Baileyella intestinalis]MCI7685943.1 ABC transporter ATP-binding protein/permease [Clostridiales bacterium]MDY2994155.1 ABC transporter ATP-binding protein [Baileyella intestinalis]MST68675.1 ABC transporter ATP-binding protein [Baileyella intestinalis]
MIKTLIRYFKPHRKLFFLDMVCAVLASLIELSFPVISRKAMYDMLPNKAFQTFFTVMTIVAVAYLLRALCYYVMTYWGHTFGIRVETDMRADLFRHLQQLDFDFYDRNRTGSLMSRLTGDLFEITELAHHGPEDLLISTLTIVGALIMMFTIEWRLALVVFILLPIFIGIIMKQRTNLSTTSKNVKVRLASINSDIESSLSGTKTSKAFANENVERERFDNVNSGYRNSKKDFYKAMGLFNAYQEFFMGIMPVVVIAFGGYLIMKDELNYIDLITFTLYVSAFVTPVRKLAQFAEIFAGGYAGLQRFSELMAVEPTVIEKDDARSLVVTDGKIDFDHVSFAYQNGQKVLSDIDLHVTGGEVTAVVGTTGGGKTTLCQLIPRFYDVTGGDIKIDGMDIRDATKDSLRRAIGIVQQDVFIFPDTIMENIRYGCPEASDEAVVMAAREAEIYDDIMEMEEGFQTYVGERGARLSGGQRQRIAIARIFLKDPKILILDEATSALDTVTEQNIQKRFDQLMKGRTSFVIAHRLSTVKNADRIVVIEKGHIQEMGTEKELLEKNGVYAKLKETQELFGE